MGRRERPDHRRRAAAGREPCPRARLCVRAAADGRGGGAAADPARRPGKACLLRQVHYHWGGPAVTTPTTTPIPAQRSVPKPEFTDAEAGAKEFPDSSARRFNYF